MRDVGLGDRCPEVGYLQRLINYQNFWEGRVENELTEDCAFGPRTLAALNAYQTLQGITPSETTNRHTWMSLGHVNEIEHEVELFPQPSDMTCWSAAATMLFGDRSVGPGEAEINPRTFGLDQDPDNIRTFLTGAGLTFHEPRRWEISELIGMIRHSPLWVAGRWRQGSHAGAHVVVVSALWSSGDLQSGGTALRIHDPWPPRRGAIYGGCYEAYTIRGFRTGNSNFNAGMLAIAHR
ncbi:MAG: hypothetical protein KGL44_00550 [Sphingomonadales bacterium]|nr:hypothetical protein [Sphingomonadales bacterium]